MLQIPFRHIIITMQQTINQRLQTKNTLILSRAMNQSGTPTTRKTTNNKTAKITIPMPAKPNNAHKHEILISKTIKKKSLEKTKTNIQK